MSKEGESNVAKCPFCGGSDVMVGRDIRTNEWYIKCFECNTTTNKSVNDVIKEVYDGNR